MSKKGELKKAIAESERTLEDLELIELERKYLQSLQTEFENLK